MNVLLCSPYEQRPGLVSGGVNIWGKNTLNYYKEVEPDFTLDAVSYDRVFDVKEDSSVFERLWYGLKEYGDAIRRTKKQLRVKKYDVLHLCTSAQLSLFKDLYVLKMARRRGVKACIHFHFGRIPDLLKIDNWEGKMIRNVCNAADSVIVIDQKSYDALVAAGYNNVHYLPNPLSMPIIRQIETAKESVARHKNKVLYVGHVIPSKGVYELVEGCKQVDGIELHIVGTIDDKVRRDLSNIAANKNNGEWLKICGGMPHEEVIKEMLSSEIFVLPSYTEGFPNVILESMACGCAIIATAVGAIPEMLQFGPKGFCGLKIDVKDSASIAHALKDFTDDKDLISFCSQNAIKRVNELYAMPMVWKQLVDTWTKTI